MSKIQIESNSQPDSRYFVIRRSCVYHVKDTNRKQFTTVRNECSYAAALCLSCQRYKSKAIHNPLKCPGSTPGVVFIMSKIQIESNSQRIIPRTAWGCCCVYHVKDTNRKQFTTFSLMSFSSKSLCLSCQRYKSKAIHNPGYYILCRHYVVFIMSKIQIESNSQQMDSPRGFYRCCVYHVKDTNRKQFTTPKRDKLNDLLLCLSCQRYKSKAIHNRMPMVRSSLIVVFIMSKIQIESNSQPM